MADPARTTPTTDSQRNDIEPDAPADSPSPHTRLYRLYDSDHRLLYIGIATDAEHPAGEHHRTQWWWNPVVVPAHPCDGDGAGGPATGEHGTGG